MTDGLAHAGSRDARLKLWGETGVTFRSCENEVMKDRQTTKVEGLGLHALQQTGKTAGALHLAISVQGLKSNPAAKSSATLSYLTMVGFRVT